VDFVWTATHTQEEEDKTYYLYDNVLCSLINIFFLISSFVLFSMCGLIRHSPVACGFFSFAIPKARRQDASNPNMSSETNPDIGRVPTARKAAQLVCKDMWLSCTGHVWDGVKRAYRIAGFIETLPGTLEKKKDTRRFWTSSVMMKSTRSPRVILDKLSSST